MPSTQKTGAAMDLSAIQSATRRFIDRPSEFVRRIASDPSDSIDENLPTPVFTYDPRTDLIAGRRPYRIGSYRLEREDAGSKMIVHNYGHGGAGITMALGCAHEVRDIIADSGWAPSQT